MMHASSTASTKIGRYANEYALFLTFTDDGKKVTRIKDFADPVAVHYLPNWASLKFNDHP
jgi:ketosteroid isomerase-like protein